VSVAARGRSLCLSAVCRLTSIDSIEIKVYVKQLSEIIMINGLIPLQTLVYPPHLFNARSFSLWYAVVRLITLQSLSYEHNTSAWNHYIDYCNVITMLYRPNAAGYPVAIPRTQIRFQLLSK